PSCRDVGMNVAAVPGASSKGEEVKPAPPQVRVVAIITGKEFVSTVAGQGDSNVLASHTTNMEGRHDRRVSKRLFQRTCQLIECLCDIGLYEELVVLSVELLRYQAGMVCLVEVTVGETYRECVDLSRAFPRHQGDDRRGVYTSAKQSSQRYIACQAHPDCLGQTILELFQAFLLRLRLVNAVVRKIPILSGLNLAAGELRKMAGWQLLNALKGSERIRDVTKVEEVQESVRVHVRELRSACQECLDL